MEKKKKKKKKKKIIILENRFQPPLDFSEWSFLLKINDASSPKKSWFQTSN